MNETDVQRRLLAKTITTDKKVYFRLVKEKHININQIKSNGSVVIKE